MLKQIIQAYDQLLKTNATTYLLVYLGTFTDVNGVRNAPIPDGSALPVRSFVGDTVRPRLLSFTISSLQIMTLTFDKPLDLDTLAIDLLRLQSGVPCPNSVFSSCSPNFTPVYYYLIESNFLSTDVLKMNVQIELGQVRGTSNINAKSRL